MLVVVVFNFNLVDVIFILVGIIICFYLLF